MREVLSAGLLVVLVACASSRPPQFEDLPPDVAPATGEILPAARSALYQERWIVDRSGSEIVFTLVVEVDGAGDFRFLALDDLGVTLAAGTGDTVTRTSRALPGPLVEALQDVLRALHAPPERAPLRPVRLRESGEEGLWDEPTGSLWTADAVWARGLAVRVHRWSGQGRWPERFSVGGRLTATVEVREPR